MFLYSLCAVRTLPGTLNGSVYIISQWGLISWGEDPMSCPEYPSWSWSVLSSFLWMVWGQDPEDSLRRKCAKPENSRESWVGSHWDWNAEPRPSCVNREKQDIFPTCAVLKPLVLTHTKAPCIHTAPAAIETPVDGLCRMNQPSRAVVPNFGCSLGSLRGLLENTNDKVPLRPIKSDSLGMGPSQWYL